jgi:cystathionine beta-lyase/cystathionine gamma-synthase
MERPNRVRPGGLAFETRAVHAGREDFEALGVHAPPLDLSTTYPTGPLADATASMDAMAGGHEPSGSPIYGRLHNPTVARYERALASLEGAEAAVAFSSGMAALTATLLAAREGGRNHVVAVRPLYGGSDHLLESGLLGHEVSFVGPQGLPPEGRSEHSRGGLPQEGRSRDLRGEIADAVREDTALVLLETPGNPTLDLVDIEAAVAAARGVPVMVDSTFMTPVLQRPLEHGAALVLHSATKFLGGHGDVIAGVVATSEAWAVRLRQVRIATGALVHPLAAFLLHRGLPTLALRVRAAQDGARMLAERLARHPDVRCVHYPGLPGADPLGLLGRQMAGPGSVLAFEVAGGFEAARRTLESVKLILSAVSLGTTDTLIQHPAALTHRIVNEGARAATGISDSLLRLSVGIEDPDDLWRDLEQALEAAHGATESATAGASGAAARTA